MSDLKIYLFGTPHLEIGNTPVSLERRKALALLVYLAVTGESHSRDTLATMLWPEADQGRARSALRRDLSVLNKALGDGWLDIERESISLNTAPGLWVDVNHFRQQLAVSQGHNHNGEPNYVDCLPQLQEAASLYRDDFLAGFTLRDSPDFDEWQRFQTEVLRRELSETLEQLVHVQSTQEDFKAAIPYARRWLALDPLHEPAHRQLMELYAQAGQRAAALHQYNECERILQEELGVPPSMETTALAERIRLETAGQQGQLIKSYELQELIGAGGFGEVYRAYQPQVRREVAVKVILPHYANQPRFIRRFEAEARMVAQLEHPHIVPLYDYWREPDGAYLVMRWLRGGSLEDALKNGPWSPEATAHLLDQIANALRLAHQRGIIHRDLKPANILLDEVGNAYLTDFGIAQEIAAPVTESQVGVVVGSPAYLAPEAINNDPLTPQADIYSLGVLLYEVLTGQHPFAEATAANIIFKHLAEPLPALQDSRPDLPAALNDVIQQATAKDPADRYADALTLAADFRQALSPDQTIITTRPDESAPLLVSNPYKGLHAFQEGDAADFFGRESLVEQLLIRLMLNIPSRQLSMSNYQLSNSQSSHLHKFLAVVGPSGSGKSSVVKAGLIPALRRDAIPGSKNWFIVEMTPGPHPLEELEAALLRVAINPPPTLLDQLQADERGLLRAVKRILPDDETELLLVIDQFEEVFTLVEDKAVRVHFLDSLRTAVTETGSRLRVVITLRADFYDRPLLYPGFGDLLRQRMETILPLSTEELEQAIAGPAERVGATLEAGLIPLIIADVQEQPGALPLMQYALTELFEQRQGRLLTIGAYQTSGGVMGALARRADELYNDLDDAGRTATRRLFLRLVTLGEGVEDTRRRVLRSELTALTTDHRPPTVDSKEAKEQGSRGEIQNPKSKIQNVIDTFGHYRLLTFDRDPVTRGPTVEVAHEALIREWDRLRQWLDEDREFLFWQQRLRAGLHQWQTSDYDEGALLRGVPLVEAENWLNQRRVDLNETEREFIQAGLALREREAAEREAQLRRELEVAQELADSEKRRAEDQAQAATSLRKRAVWLAGVGVIAVLLALAAGMFGVQSSQNAEQAVLAEQTAEARRQQAETAQTEAEASRAHAEREARRARASQLASQAQIVLESDEDPSGTLPLLLARQAVLTTLTEDGYFTAEADAALRQVVDSAPILLQTFSGHTNSVVAADFSPDGKTLATGSLDQTVRLWDVATGQELHRLEGHINVVWSVDFSPDGKTLVSASPDRTIRLWDVATGAEIRRFEGHAGTVIWSVFSPDGKTIATAGDSTSRFGASSTALFQDGMGSQGFDKTIRLWDVETGEEIRRFEIDVAAVPGARGRGYGAYSPDGQTIVTSGDDNTARLWDVVTGEEIRHFEGHTAPVAGAVFSPDGQTIVTASLDKTIRLWDAATGEEIRRFEGHTDQVWTASFSPDGQTIVSAGEDGIVRLWDVATGEEIYHPAGHTVGVPFAAFSPDGRSIIITSGSPENSARLWAARPNGDTRRLEALSPIRSVAVSPDGQIIVTAGADNRVRLWDAATGEEITRLEGHTGRVNTVAFSPDGQMLASAGFDKTIRLWDAVTNQEIGRIEGLGSTILSLAFSPDGQTIATAGEDKIVRLWDVNTGQEIRQFVGHTAGVNAVAFRSDGQTIATGGEDKTVRLWDMESGEEVRRLEGHTFAVRSVDFSPDGQTLVSAGTTDTTVRLWDVELGREIGQLGGHEARVNTAVFSPDGHTIVTAGKDGVVLVWDVETRSVIRRLDGHTSHVFAAAFSPDGQTIVTASDDKTARIWPSIETLLKEAESLIQRDPPEFTSEERIRFGLATE